MPWADLNRWRLSRRTRGSLDRLGNFVEARVFVHWLAIIFRVGEFVDHGGHRCTLLLHRWSWLRNSGGFGGNRFGRFLDGRWLYGLGLGFRFRLGICRTNGRGGLVLHTCDFLQTLAFEQATHGHLGRKSFLAGEPIGGAHGRRQTNRGWVDIILEVF